MPVLLKVTQVMILNVHNLAHRVMSARQSFPILQHRTTAEQNLSAIEQPRAKRPWCMHQGYRQMKSRRAAMQGKKKQGGLQPI